MQVALYDDRLEVTSPGMLLGGVSIQKMKDGYSKFRNRGLALAFTYMKIIEGWGSGTPRMIRECKNYGLSEPELCDFDGDFRINIYRVEFGNSNPTQGATQLATGLTEFDIDLIKTIQRNSKITQSEMALELGCAINRVKYYTKKLRDKGIIIYNGSGQKGSWEVKFKIKT